MQRSRFSVVLFVAGAATCAGCMTPGAPQGASPATVAAPRLHYRYNPSRATVRRPAAPAVTSRYRPSRPSRTQRPRADFDDSAAPLTWTTIGRSVQGRPIEAVQLGHGSQRVLVIGSVHGDEEEGVSLAGKLAEHLHDNPAELIGRTVYVVRDANPDGTLADSRTNANGVDLNRNFPASNWKRLTKGGNLTSGSRPASEPETKALLDVLQKFNPHRIVVVHSTRGSPLVNYDGPAQSLAQAMSRHNGYQVTDDIGYPTPGSFGSYAGIDHNLPIITLELPRGIDPTSAWRQNREALVAAIQFSGGVPELLPGVRAESGRSFDRPPIAPPSSFRRSRPALDSVPKVRVETLRPLLPRRETEGAGARRRTRIPPVRRLQPPRRQRRPLLDDDDDYVAEIDFPKKLNPSRPTHCTPKG